MIVGFDIDGVLFPWDDCARDGLVERFGIERPAPSTYWSYLKDVLEPEQWKWLWTHEGQDNVFGRVERVYPGAVDAINDILRLGHQVHFVTHRDPRRTSLHTAAFLTLHFGGHPWAGVHVVQNSVQKRRLMRWDVFVDDKPETVLDIINHTPARVFAPHRPWNDEELSDIDGCGGFTHYTDPQEIADWVAVRS